MTDIVDQFLTLTLADYRKVVEEMDEARDAARYMMESLRLEGHAGKQERERWPWLEETPNKDD